MASQPIFVFASGSPSPRRAWIEMSVCGCSVQICFIVALPTEGVD